MGFIKNPSPVKRPILRYHGGKWMLANWIIGYFPPHRVYTEAFGGGASVLLQKPRSYSEIYNDQWDMVVNVFRVLRDPEQAAELERRLRLTPFARSEFQTCNMDTMAMADPIEKARLTIFRSFAGFGSAATNSNFATGFRSNSNRSGTTPAHDWKNYPDCITAFTDRLKGIVIENRDYQDVLKTHDSRKTLHFLDPPYVHITRNLQRGNASYAHEMTDDDHRTLSRVAHSLEGMVVLCGYPSALYDELYKDWVMVSRKAHADGAVDRVECLWINPACWQQQTQPLLF